MAKNTKGREALALRYDKLVELDVDASCGEGVPSGTQYEMASQAT